MREQTWGYRTWIKTVPGAMFGGVLFLVFLVLFRPGFVQQGHRLVVAAIFGTIAVAFGATFLHAITFRVRLGEGMLQVGGVFARGRKVALSGVRGAQYRHVRQRRRYVEHQLTLEGKDDWLILYLNSLRGGQGLLEAVIREARLVKVDDRGDRHERTMLWSRAQAGARAGAGQAVPTVVATSDDIWLCCLLGAALIAGYCWMTGYVLLALVELALGTLGAIMLARAR